MHQSIRVLLAFGSLMGSGLSAATILTTGSWDGATKHLHQLPELAPFGLTASNVNTSQLASDAYWENIVSSGDIAVMILEVAGHKNLNRFGVFQKTQSGITHSEVFNGAASAGAVSLPLLFPNGPFGFYLQYNTSYYYSDAAMNAGGHDQLATFRGPLGGANTVFGQLWDENSYLLAWEDLPYANSDKDFNDMVLMIRVQPKQVPDSGSTALMILGGLLAVAGLRRKLA